MSTVQITTKNFKREVLDFDGIVLLDFWAPWCGPCRKQRKVLDRIEREQPRKIKICKVNIDEVPEFARKYRVYNIPTLIVFDHGKMRDRAEGLQTKEQVELLLIN